VNLSAPPPRPEEELRLIQRRRFLQFAGAGIAMLGGRSSSASTPDGLRRAPPAEVGVDAETVTGFLDAVTTAGMEVHSFMLYRQGAVAAQGWWWPYRSDRPHMMHSLTKSVTACGVGLAIAEGRFGLDDRVVSFFPDQLPATVDTNLAAMRVRDLLSMQTGQKTSVSGSVWRQLQTSWISEFFKIPVVDRPGTSFVYTSAASYMLSAIVTKTTGERLRDYLEPRLFAPLGIRKLHWDIGPDGVNPGGNGLSWTTADALKLGILHAQRGRWHGREILPAAWVQAVGTPHTPGGEYGFQWWIGPQGAYFADGLFTQLSVVFPAHEAALALTAAVTDDEAMLKIIWAHFPAAFETRGGTATVAEQALRRRDAALRLLAPLSATHSPLAEQISGREYRMAPNEDGVLSVSFEFARNRCRFQLADARGRHTVTVGTRVWMEGDTTMTGNKLHHEYQPDRMRIVAGGEWLDPQTFEMTWQFVESAFRDRVVCRFDGDSLTLDRRVNVNSEATSRPTLYGTLV